MLLVDIKKQNLCVLDDCCPFPLFLSFKQCQTGNKDWPGERDLTRGEGQLIEFCLSWYILIILLNKGKESSILTTESTVKWID